MTSPASCIEHTLLKPTTTGEEVLHLCEEAVEYGFAAVCIPPVHVPLAAERLYGSDVEVATVAGFPLGYLPAEIKAAEAAAAVAAGAAEIDMVIHIGAALEGRLDRVEMEICQVTAAAGAAPVKVILECCYLSDASKRQVVECAVNGGATYVKTSTGFGTGGADINDVRLLAAAAGGRLRVKAAGGIRDWETCRRMLAAGADRIGTSSGPQIMAGWRRAAGGAI
jgi:deoxyribose-phosphate aldolase